MVTSFVILSSYGSLLLKSVFISTPTKIILKITPILPVWDEGQTQRDHRQNKSCVASVNDQAQPEITIRIRMRKNQDLDNNLDRIIIRSRNEIRRDILVFLLLCFKYLHKTLICTTTTNLGHTIFSVNHYSFSFICWHQCGGGGFKFGSTESLGSALVYFLCIF